MSDIESLTLLDLIRLIEQKDNSKIVQLLSEFKEKWNSLMQEKDEHNKFILKNLDLKGKNLQGVDLSDTLIEDSDFSDADLSDAKFDSAVISGTNFYGSNLSGASINSARITQSNLSHSNLYHMQMNGTVLTGSVNFFEVYFSSTNEDEKKYQTHPEITRRGFRQIEYAEQMLNNDEEELYY